MHPLTYACNCQVHRSIAEAPFLLVLSRGPPGPTTIESSTALPPDANNATNPVILQQRILAQLVSMCPKVSGTMAQQQVRHKR